MWRKPLTSASILSQDDFDPQFPQLLNCFSWGLIIGHYFVNSGDRSYPSSGSLVKFGMIGYQDNFWGKPDN
jgi:hypothetical protein